MTTVQFFGWMMLGSVLIAFVAQQEERNEQLAALAVVSTGLLLISLPFLLPPHA